MRNSSPLRLVLALALLSCAVLATAEKAAAEKDKQPSAPGKDKDKKGAAPAKAEKHKTPGDGIFILVDQLSDVLKLAPRGYLLTPEKYKELLDQIESLKALARPNLPVPPSSCSLKGKIEGNVAQLQARFKFRTDQPNSLVFVACAQATINTANIDGATVDWRNEVDRYTAQIEKPGDHELFIDLAVQISARAGGLNLELDLPRATSTHVELELSAGASDLRIAGKPLEAPATFQNNRLDAQLGLSNRLDLGWKDARMAGGSTPLLSAEGRVLVRIDEKFVTTTAELTLATQGGPVKVWQIATPAGTELKPALADQMRIQAIESKDGPGGALQTIRLKDASLDPLRVTLTFRSPPPKPGNSLPVGPFHLLGATRQSGVVLVSNGALDLRPQLHSRGELVRRELTDDERGSDATLIAAFTYRTVGGREKAAAVPAWLDLDVENVRGLLETRISHTLRLQRIAPDRLSWRGSSTVDATPIRRGVDHLELQLPADYDYDKQRGPRPADLVRYVEIEDSNRLLHLKLGADPTKPFQLTIDGSYRQTVMATGRSTFALPVPRDTRDRGGLITIEAPDDVELLVLEGTNFNLELSSQEPQRLRWRANHIPEKVEIGWKPYRPQLRVASLIDLQLTPHQGQVRHQMRLQFANSVSPHFTVRVADSVADRLHVVEGGETVEARPNGTPLRQIRLLKAAGKEHLVTFEYSFPLGPRQPGKPLTIPLVVPEDAAGGDTKVRVWSDPGELPLPPEGAWTELNVEEVNGRDRLPVLVIRSQRVDAPLNLPMGTSSADGSPSVLLERALVRATLHEGGGQEYFASFLVRQIATPTLDLELPSSILGSGLRVTWDGKALDWETPDDGHGRVARLRIGPDLMRRPAMLDVWYHLPAGRSAGNLLTSRLQPPIVRGAQEHAPVRWQVQLPQGWVPLAPEGGMGGERSWSWQRRLLTPRLVISNADMERWLIGSELSGRAELRESAAGWPSHVLWRNDLEPMTLVHMPQLAWFLVCSLGILLVGRALSRLGQSSDAGSLAPSPWFLPALALICLALAFLWLLYSTLLTAILYGGQIGLVVLLIWLAVEFILRERFRRQVVFLPSFSRARKGSSLVRPGGSSVRQRSQPSTVDAPPPSEEGVP